MNKPRRKAYRSWKVASKGCDNTRDIFSFGKVPATRRSTRVGEPTIELFDQCRESSSGGGDAAVRTNTERGYIV